MDILGLGVRAYLHVRAALPAEWEQTAVGSKDPLSLRIAASYLLGLSAVERGYLAWAVSDPMGPTGTRMCS